MLRREYRRDNPPSQATFSLMPTLEHSPQTYVGKNGYYRR
jgi:hypothetical protein